MGDPLFDWIIQKNHFQAILLVMAALWPVGVWAVGKVWRGGDNSLRSNRRFFGMICAIGPLIFLMWLVYNFILGSIGFDSVAALGINLLLFIAAGLIAGRLLRSTFSHRND